MNEAHIQLAYSDFFKAPAVRVNPLARWAYLLTPKYLRLGAKFMMLTGLVVLLLAFLPTAWYELTGFNELATSAATEAEFSQAVEQKNLAYQPAFDPNLPLTNSVKINSIGVNGEIHEATHENHETALMNGIWRADDFGTPAERKLPTILVAHRFGYVWWSNQFRRENSFYNLEKLKVGDVVEVVWRQRTYKYEIYAESQGAEITDYSGDLILYTCQDLTSDQKFFKYGKLLEI